LFAWGLLLMQQPTLKKPQVFSVISLSRNYKEDPHWFGIGFRLQKMMGCCCLIFGVGEQGMDSLNKFCIMVGEEAKTLCKVLHQPRGTVGNPLTPHPSFAVSVCTR